MKFSGGLILLLVVFSCKKTVPLQPERDTPTGAKELYELGDQFYHQHRYDSAIGYYQKARELLISEIDPDMLSNVTNDIGLSYKKMGKFDSAIRYYNLAIDVDLRAQDTISLAGRWRNLANLYESQGWHTEALKLYLDALRILGTSYPEKATPLYLAIGNIFLSHEDYPSALRYYGQAILNLDSSNSMSVLAITYNNLGSTYLNMNQLDSAHIYLWKAIQIKSKNDSSLLPATLNELSLLWLKKNRLDSSRYYLDLSHDILEEIGDTYGMAENDLLRARLEITGGNATMAKEHLFSAMSYANHERIGELNLKCYELLSELYVQEEDFERAYGFLKEWSIIRDSVFNKGKLETEKMMSKYALDKEEEQRLEAQRQANLAGIRADQNRTITYILLFFLALLSILTWIIYHQRMKLGTLNMDLVKKNRKIDALNQQNFHFTKNSLMGIVSMMSRQMDHFKGQKVYSILLEEKLRMESINLLYQQLFNSSNAESVNLSHYLVEVCKNTLENMVQSKESSIHITVNNVHSNSETAFVLGLIVNEVCINACKYAYPVNPHLEMLLEMEEQNIHLRISDSGPGFPAGFDWKTTTSFGVQLIRVLSDDIKAMMLVESSLSGICYNFRIPKSVKQ